MYRSRGQQFFWVAFGIMFILIGIGVILGLIYNRGTGILQGITVALNWLWIPFLLFIFVAFIVFVFRVPFFMMRERWGRRDWRSGGDDAEEIVKQRYAKGEITREQFDQMMSDLSKNRN